MYYIIAIFKAKLVACKTFIYIFGETRKSEKIFLYEYQKQIFAWETVANNEVFHCTVRQNFVRLLENIEYESK